MSPRGGRRRRWCQCCVDELRRVVPEIEAARPVASHVLDHAYVGKVVHRVHPEPGAGSAAPVERPAAVGNPCGACIDLDREVETEANGVCAALGRCAIETHAQLADVVLRQRAPGGTARA